MYKVRVGDTKNTGKGLFARKNLKKGEIIFIAKGRRVHFLVKTENDSKKGERWLGIGKNLWLDPKNTNPWHYINHSCKPNAGIRGMVTVVALRNVKKDEEITIDYSITETDRYWSMKCHCNQPNCRKTIRSAQFLPKKKIWTYLPYIPKYTKNFLSKTGK